MNADVLQVLQCIGIASLVIFFIAVVVKNIMIRYSKCEHDFSKWAVTSKLVSSIGGVSKITQERTCPKCGLTEFKRQTLD